MAFDLNKQIGPFPLKVWLIIGVGGVGIGLFVASKQNSGKGGVTSDKGLANPPQVFFSKVTIGLEHVPGTTTPVPPIKPPKMNPIMPSNPAAEIKPEPTTKPPPTIGQGLPPIRTTPVTPAPVAYTAVNPSIWQSFISGTPLAAGTITNPPRTTTQPIFSGLDERGVAYF